MVYKGWSLETYLVEAILTETGYETVIIWGVQGTGKSSLMLTLLFWLYYAYAVLEANLTHWTFEKMRDILQRIKDQNEEAIKEFAEAVEEVQESQELLTEEELNEIWWRVLKSLVFKPQTFVEKLEETPEETPIIALGWDDIGVHFPSTKFKTDLKQYEAIDSTWAAIRTKAKVILCTIPLIDRLAKNIKDNTTIEVFIGKNLRKLVNRCFRLPAQKSIESNFFKVILEEPEMFDLFFAPKWVWIEYWGMRIELTREALRSLRSATDMIDVNLWIPVIEAAEIAFSQNIKYSASTIQQDASRGILKHERIGNVLCVGLDDFFRMVVLKGGYDVRKDEQK